MYLKKKKKMNNEVYLNEPIGKDKDDNIITLQEVLENDDRNIEEVVDIRMKIKALYNKMKKILKKREKTILELRFGLGGTKPKTQNEIAKMMIGTGVDIDKVCQEKNISYDDETVLYVLIAREYYLMGSIGMGDDYLNLADRRSNKSKEVIDFIQSVRNSRKFYQYRKENNYKQLGSE